MSVSLQCTPLQRWQWTAQDGGLLGIEICREHGDDFMHGRIRPGRKPNQTEDNGEDVHQEPPVEATKVSLLLPHGDVTQGRKYESKPCAGDGTYQGDEETQSGDHCSEDNWKEEAWRLDFYHYVCFGG